MKNYKEFTISSLPFNTEILSSVLWQLDILGVNEFDDHLKIFVYDDSDISIHKIEQVLQNAKNENLFQSYHISEQELESKNWNEVWESKIKVIEVTNKIVIKPSFRNYEAKPDQLVLTIDPKMSFGTGEHQTTKIVLTLLEKHIKQNTKVLDVGSGTAVLAIAASKLGAKEVIAVDNDEWCSINGQENIDRNEIKNIDVVLGEISDVNDDNFDLILANINRHILLDIKNHLYLKFAEGGKIILSGILHSDESEIKRQFTQLGLTAIETYQLDEWVGIVLIKN